MHHYLTSAYTRTRTRCPPSHPPVVPVSYMFEHVTKDDLDVDIARTTSRDVADDASTPRVQHQSTADFTVEFYKYVPRRVVILLCLPLLAVCSFVWIRLGTWGSCAADGVAANDIICINPTYTVFAHSPKEACSCSAILFDERPREHCNSTHNVAVRHQLNASLSVATHVVTAYLSVTCPESIALVNSLVAGMKKMEVLLIYKRMVLPRPGDDRIRLEQLALDGLRNLTVLHIQGVPTEDVPWIGNLTNLKDVRLIEMGIVALPPSFKNLAQVQTVRVLRNRLTALPESFGELQQLRNLNFER